MQAQLKIDTKLSGTTKYGLTRERTFPAGTRGNYRSQPMPDGRTKHKFTVFEEHWWSVSAITPRERPPEWL